MKRFGEAIISGECGLWSQDLGASLGFGALPPRGESFKAATKSWAALRSFQSPLWKEPLPPKCREAHN